MCGLIVYLKTSDRSLDPGLIETMTHSMEHRGPDDFGMCFVGNDGPILWRNAHNAPPINEKGVAMGHRRLSVFDLTEVGRQPFLSRNKRFVMVFNGEIYNYVELRDELSGHGVSFSTNCDTEVLLAAFEKWGSECFKRLNGCWAVVIWDDLTKELFVSRDRLGEKPLVYTQIDGDWIFASEIKTILKHPKIDAQPDARLLMCFIATGSGPAGEQTFFSNIKSVEPGTFLILRGGNVSKIRYWNLDMTSPRRSDDALAVQELDQLLIDSVRLRLRGDIRVGAMLSGGLDSTSVISSIAALFATRPDESRMVGDVLQAFTASFPGRKNDETDKVEELCRLIEISPHKTFPMDQVEIEEHLMSVARNMEAPFFSAAVIVYDMLMKLVRASDVQIVLDGLGGDELFGGFEWYIPLAIRDNLRGLRLWEAMNNITGMRSKHGKSLRYLLRRAPHPRGSSIRSTRDERKDWHSDLFQSEWRSAMPSSQINGENHLDHALKVDLLEYNAPRWLHMSDRISMANSVVCRSPFLDFRLVEFAFTLDNNLKIRNAETKYILREAKRGVLPTSIVNDFRKIRLSGPGAHWLKGSLKDFVLSLRDDKDSKLSCLVRADALRSVIDDFFNSKHGDANRIWRIVNSEAFLKAYS
jgi:asparagine synthase (glutamine-hydrolysing)